MTRRSRSPWPPQRPRHRCCERPGQRPRGTPWETVSARSTSFQRRSNSPQIRCHLSLQQTPSPLTLLEEYASALRALLAGDRVNVEGRYVRLHAVALDWPPERPPPLML